MTVQLNFTRHTRSETARGRTIKLVLELSLPYWNDLSGWNCNILSCMRVVIDKGDDRLIGLNDETAAL